MSGEEPKVMTEEEEEDDYFSRMCDAAISDDVDEGMATEEPAGQGMGVVSEGEPDEEAWYSRMAGQSSSLVLEEQSMVWQSLLRQSAGADASLQSQSLGHRSTKLILVGQGATSSLLMLQQFLFSQLPKSSMMFNNVNRMLARQTDLDKDWSLFCDHVNHPSLIVLVSVYSSGVLESDMSLSVFSSMPLSLDLAQQIASVVAALKRKRKIGDDGQAAGDQKVTIQGLDVWSCKEPLLKALSNVGLHPQWTEPANLWCLLDALPPAQGLGADLGVDLQPLNIDDAPTVNDNWKYKSNYSILAVQGLIASGLPCLGARCRATGRLVGWVLTQPYGAIGMLFTMPEYRGRGVARLLIRSLLGQWLKHEPPFQCAPFCYITPDNDSSMAAFRALGFCKVTDQEWVGLSFA